MSKQDHIEGVDDQDVLDPVAERRIKLVTIAASVFVVALAIGLAIHYWPEAKEEKKVLPEAQAPAPVVEATAEIPRTRFVDRGRELGLDFVHVSGATGRKLLPETMGSGAAFFDMDGDGDPDLYLASGCSWPGDEPVRPGGGRLYRNDGGHFVDVSADSGLDTRGFYGMGVAVGDYDGDGREDLYLTAVGPNRLYRNLGAGRFEDVTTATGVAGTRGWSSGAAFLDHDLDGDLDLVVLNYITWSPELDLVQGFQLTGLGRAYGPPTGFQGSQIELFRNDGGRFVETAASAGLRVLDPYTGVDVAKSLAIEVCDLDDDGRPDLLVANDTVRNFAFVNRGEGRFEEVGCGIGIAYDETGNARGAMGLQAADVRNDGSLAVAVGNFANEMTAFYVNEDRKDPFFIDEATSAGLGAATRDSLTFGLAMFDFDLDGYLDLACANGHVEPEIEKVQASQRHAQRPELFWNGHHRRFLQVGADEAGPDLFQPMVGRGLATADVDGDGDLDLLITANGGSPRLLINEGPTGHSLRLDLRLGANGAPALGARVRLRGDFGVQERYLSGGGGYLSQSEHLLTFGLGAATEARNVEIRWPDGRVQWLEHLAAGRHRIVAP
ncbi:MAG: CRTAC1 family protein [Planctomycetes bacterium]|nr:CRTAC1 family protein [Planctomycetota bacterium]